MPRAYYNEIEPYPAQWLRNLIGQGLIADGDVDTRSIADVTPNDIKGYAQCHFFAGLGGWSGALRSSGVWPDHREVWTGSCPCQPFSLAGKQGGFDDERHLWPHWQYLISQCRPPTILGEQVASAAQWLGLVRGDLEALGYAVGAIPVEAASAGADHLRDRYWFVAHPDDAGPQGRRLLPECAGERLARQDGMADADGERGQVDSDAGGRASRSGARSISGFGGASNGDMADAAMRGRESCSRDEGLCREDRAPPPATFEPCAESDLGWVIGADGKARRVKPGIRLLAHGVPARVAKLRALGNAIDLRPAAAFIQAVSESIQ